MPDEQLLIDRAKTDSQAFGPIFDYYYPKIFNYILHRIGDVAAAQDLTSIVFFKTLNQLHRFTWRGVPFSAWLYRIATNEINTYFRAAQSRPASLDALFEEHNFELPAGTDLERELIERQEQIQHYHDFRRLRQVMLELPFKYQEVLALRYFEKKSLADISLITGKKLGTVKSLLSRGLERLRQLYAAEYSQMQPSVPPAVIKVEE